MEPEYVLYGLAAGDNERWQEQLLATDVQSKGTARLAKIQKLAAADGWHSFRTALIDLSTPPGFRRTLNRTH